MQMETRVLLGQSTQAKSTCADFATRHTVGVIAALLANIAKSQDLIKNLIVGKNLGSLRLTRKKGTEVQSQSERARTMAGDKRQRNLQQGQEKPEIQNQRLTETRKPNQKQT